MKQSIKRVLIASTCVALSGGAAYGIGTLTNTSDTTTSEVAVNSDDESVVTDTEASSKQETVYVVSDAYGNAESITVSNYLKNEDGETYIKDTNNLTDVKDVKGDSTYDAKTGEWKTDGSDVYYQGTSNKQLPVTMSITYKLDGKTVNPEDIKGKSGKLEMTYTYTNNEQVTVDGQKVCVPFVVLTGMILDNDIFSNVKVTNGKVEDDGDKRVVIGYAMPGVQDALGVSSKDYSIPSEFSITANVKKFDLGMSMTYVDNSLFNSLDLSKVDDLDSLKSSLKTLSDSSDQLVDGTSQLYDGLTTLLNSVEDGTSGLKALTDNSSALNAGAKEVLDKNIETANETLNNNNILTTYNGGEFNLTVDNYDSEFDRIISDFEDAQKNKSGTLYDLVYNQVYAIAYQTGYKTAETKIKNANKTIKAAGTQYGVDVDIFDVLAYGAVQGKSITESVSNATDYTTNVITVYATYKQCKASIENMKAAIQNVKDNSNGAITTDEAALAYLQAQHLITQEDIDAYNEYLPVYNLYNTIQDKLTDKIKYKFDDLDDLVTYMTKQNNATIVAGAKQETINQLSTNKETLKETKTKIDDYRTKFYPNLLKYTGGVDKAYKALVEGITKLVSGSKQVKDGMAKFDDEGIDKLVDLYDNNVDKLINKFKALSDASKGYTSYCGSSNSTSVRFIIRTDVTK